jgi:molecular chaperone GrpE
MTQEKKKVIVAGPEDVAKYGGESADAVSAPEAVSSESKLPSLEEQLVSLARERDEFKDKMLRAQAECANISKRLHQQHGEALRLAGMNLARSILPVVDNLERTLASLGDAHADEAVVQGVRLIHEQLLKTLSDHGIQPIASVGKPFDPTLHEALMHDRQTQQSAGTVTQEYERGYLYHDRVLRHAKVAVAADSEGRDGDGTVKAVPPGATTE